MPLLTWEDGIIRIDGRDLPGDLVDLSVDNRVRFDEQSVDASSGKKRTPLGWEDIEVNATLRLSTEADGPDCYDGLEIINKIFRGADSQANPKIYQIDNRHLLARGVSELIFSGLSSAETDQDDTIIATMTFVENNPPVVKTERAVARDAFEKAAEDEAKKKARSTMPTIDPKPEAAPDDEKIIIDVS